MLVSIATGRAATLRYDLDLSENPFLPQQSFATIAKNHSVVERSMFFCDTFVSRLGDLGVSLLAKAVQRRDCHAALAPVARSILAVCLPAICGFADFFSAEPNSIGDLEFTFHQFLEGTMKPNGLIQTNLFVAPTDFAKVLQLRDVGCGAEGASLSVVCFFR